MSQAPSGLFKVYKSSAGSGKTYTLVKEYLRLVLVAPYKYKHILAITFTNKAANEMKERIIKQLSELFYNNDLSKNSILHDLQDETHLSIDELRKNAGIVLQNILHNYSDFAISTIDSFTHKIVSIFAYDLKLPLKFDVELENENLIAEAVNAIIEKIGTDEELTGILMQFAEENLLQGKNWQIDADLKKLSSEIFKEHAPHYLEKIRKLSLSDFRKIANELNGENRKFRNEVEEIGKSVFSKIKGQGVTEEDFYRGKQGIYTYFKNLCKFNKEKLLPNSYVIISIEEDKWYSAKADIVAKQKIDFLKQSMISAFEELQILYQNELEAYISRELLLENLYSLALLNEIYHVIHEQSNKNNTLHISEFNKRIAELISGEPAPFIYERIGERYDHYFIDEFQDTSILQWQNLLPLIENSLSKGEFNLLVGDAKQAIYRFRQGEVEQFIELPNIYKRGNQPFLIEREKLLNRNFQLKVLDKNYRSCRQIVDFNNDFFESSAEYLNEKYKSVYLGNKEQEDTGLRQEAVREGGYVSLEFIAKEEYKTNTCEKVFQTISETKLAGYGYKDIVILARSKNELNIIAEYLSKKEISGNKINIISSESFQLWNSTEVRFLFALLQFLENEGNYVAQAQILEFLQEKALISSEEKEKYFSNLFSNTGKESLLQFLEDKGLNLNTEVLLRQSIYDIIESLIRTFHLDKTVDVYLIAFLDFAADWLANSNQNLSGFLEILDEEIKKIYIKIPDNLDAVRLMTIHKSKGLEFPVVIYSFADSGLKLQDNLWIESKQTNTLQTGLIKLKKEVEKSYFKEFYEEEKQKSILDIFNVLYVALTRASERLYIFTKEVGTESERISYSALFKEFLYKKGIWKKEKSIYEFGSKDVSVFQTNNDKNNQLVLNDFVSNSWTERAVVSYQIPPCWHPEKVEGPVEKGILLHRILSYIIYEEDISKAVDELVNNKLLEQEKADEFIKYLLSFISNPLIKPFFEKGSNVKTEAEVIIENGRSLRFDRIIFKPEETIIIDFKTGRMSDLHEGQMRNYKQAVEKMGYTGVKTYLIYLPGKEDVKLIEV